MSGLILKLRPHEELMINGVVLQNGDRKAKLRVKTDGAAILRLKDAMRPEEATTPLKRAYYVAQLAVSGEIASAEAADMLARALDELTAGASVEQASAVARASEELANRRFYGVMRRLGELVRPQNDAAAG